MSGCRVQVSSQGSNVQTSLIPAHSGLVLLGQYSVPPVVRRRPSESSEPPLQKIIACGPTSSAGGETSWNALAPVPSEGSQMYAWVSSARGEVLVAWNG